MAAVGSVGRSSGLRARRAVTSKWLPKTTVRIIEKQIDIHFNKLGLLAEIEVLDDIASPLSANGSWRPGTT